MPSRHRRRKLKGALNAERRVHPRFPSAMIATMVFFPACGSEDGPMTTPHTYYYSDLVVTVTAPDGLPVPGAEVTVEYLGHLDTRVVRRTRQGNTNVDGEYRRSQPEVSMDDPFRYSPIRVSIDPPSGTHLASAAIEDSIRFARDYPPPLTVIAIQLEDEGGQE